MYEVRYIECERILTVFWASSDRGTDVSEYKQSMQLRHQADLYTYVAD